MRANCEVNLRFKGTVSSYDKWEFFCPHTNKTMILSVGSGDNPKKYDKYEKTRDGFCLFCRDCPDAVI